LHVSLICRIHAVLNDMEVEGELLGRGKGLAGRDRTKDNGK
jgi:hypothetical protein